MINLSEQCSNRLCSRFPRSQIQRCKVQSLLHQIHRLAAAAAIDPRAPLQIYLGQTVPQTGTYTRDKNRFHKRIPRPSGAAVKRKPVRWSQPPAR